MKQQRILTALVASVVISGSCTFLLALTMRHRSAPQRQPDLMYAAPARPIEAGEILKPNSIEMVAWPAGKPLSGTFLKAADLVGRAALYPLAKDQPVLEREVSAVGVGAGLAARIPDGRRAIALRSDEVAGVAGFLTPGCHVDVLGTFRSPSSPDPVTAIVLEDVEVLAVGQRAQPDPEAKPAPAVTVVTLLLTPEEAELAVLATSQGTVHFVLRNGADVDRHKGVPVQLSMLSGLAEPEKAVARTPSVPPALRIRPIEPPRSAEIETVLGGAAAAHSEEKVRQ